MNSGIDIKLTGSYQAGRCFWKYSYEVTSTAPLTQPAFGMLRDLGFLPNGQGFGYYQTFADGTTAPVPEAITWRDRPKPSFEDRIDHEDRTTTFIKHYIYRVNIEIDSSD